MEKPPIHCEQAVSCAILHTILTFIICIYYLYNPAARTGLYYVHPCIGSYLCYYGLFTVNYCQSTFLKEVK